MPLASTISAPPSWRASSSRNEYHDDTSSSFRPTTGRNSRRSSRLLPFRATITEKEADEGKGLDPSAECLAAWVELKEALCNAPTLAYPDFTKPFILYVDGSKRKGYGAALHQKDADGVEWPILFLSKDLTPAENGTGQLS